MIGCIASRFPYDPDDKSRGEEGQNGCNYWYYESCASFIKSGHGYLCSREGWKVVQTYCVLHVL